MDVAVDGLRDSSAFHEAYRWMKQRIRDGRLRAGDRVKAEDVAAELGMSRMPVREAIRQLSSEGLLTLRPNRGAVVTELSADEILELFEMRAALEALAMRRAAERVTAAALEDLGVDLARLAAARGDVDLWMTRHDAFHERIAAIAGGAHLATELRRLRTAVEPYLRPGIAGQKIERAVPEHQRLIDALARRDPAAAEAEMREHVLETARELLAG